VGVDPAPVAEGPARGAGARKGNRILIPADQKRSFAQS
jgi:hypothetical protein